MVEEAFLHYIWKFQLFDQGALRTEDGSALVVLHPGHHNDDAGPDFENARIKIGNIEWAGHVEIHVRSSDWLKHRHQTDPKYDNVILHVVFEDDRPVSQAGQALPTLVIAGRLRSGLLENYRRLRENLHDVPCHDQLNTVSELKWSSMITRVVAERLEQKVQSVVQPLLVETGNDWEEVAYIVLARALGMKINTACMEQLARSLPSNILAKHQHEPIQIEALVFGMAGFLDDEASGFQDDLRREYQFLKTKYGLHQRLARHHWKFARLRPANFPTLRLAQLSGIMKQKSGLMSNLIGISDFKALKTLLLSPVSTYWLNHYDFGKTSKASYQMGQMALSGILINAIVPLLVAYGKHIGEQALVERALAWLEQLPPEDNKILRKWKAYGRSPKSAFESQGQLQLFNAYCLKRRCLSCEVGTSIISA